MMRTTRVTTATAAGLSALLLLCGCRGATLTADEPQRETLTPADFIGGPAGATAPVPRRAGPTPVSIDPPAAQPLPAYQVTPGAPSTASGSAQPIGEPELIEAKIGDINGRPIFVGRFLEPLSGRLTAEAETANNPNAWLGFANEQIIRRLNEIIVDELLRAEALETLSEEQKLGLRAFLETVRQDIQSENLGSREIARRRLQEERGLTEEQFLQRTQEATLIRIAVQERIEPRVTVSWRDIEQRYEKDQEIYNPLKLARFRRIVVRAEQQAEIEAALAAGTPFEQIASREVNRMNAAEGGLLELEIESTLADLTVFPNDTLNDAATSLREGEIAGPLSFGSSVAWIKLDEVVDRSVPLYDAQQEIEQRIRGERTQAELQRFLQRKVAEANVGNLDDIRRRLLAVAAERYGPSRGPRQ